jgi:hypothetical protein
MSLKMKNIIYYFGKKIVYNLLNIIKSKLKIKD